jgi:hypothetical protein
LSLLLLLRIQIDYVVWAFASASFRSALRRRYSAFWW